MSSSVQFDSNTWYQIVNLGTGDGSGLQVGYPNTEGKPYGSVYGSPFDIKDNGHYWQIVQNPLDNSGWLFRCRSLGPGLFAAINNNVVCTDNGTCPDTEVRIQPQLEQTTVMYVDAWDSSSSSYYIYPSQNGSQYLWDFQDNGSWIWLNTSANADTSNIQSDAQWAFVDLSAINDPTWSTVSTTASYTATLGTAAPDSASASQSAFTIAPHAASTNFPKHSSNGSSGLATGAQAAIGAAVGGFVVIALIVFGFWFLRRRKRRQTTNQDYHYDYSAVQPSGPQIVEAPNPESNGPVELPASRAYNNDYYNPVPQDNTDKYPTTYTGYTGYTSTTTPPPPQMPEKHEYQRPYS